MFKHDLKLSLKHCIRNKWLTTIKVGGLALGIASLFFIFLWLNNEFKYDQFHPDSNRIYRIISEIHYDRSGHLCPGRESAGYLYPFFFAIRVSIEPGV